MALWNTLLKSTSLGLLILFIFTGCSRTVGGVAWCNGGLICPKEEQISEKIFSKTNIDTNNIRVFIDDSIDKQRNKDFTELMVEAINSNDEFQDVVMLGADSYKGKDESLLNTTKILMNFYAPSGNHVFVKASYDSNGLVGGKKNYEPRKYTAKVLDEKSFEITGYKDDQEALALYLYLVRSTIKYGFGTDFREKIDKKFKESEHKFLNPVRYYGGMSLEFDARMLSKENRLVIKSAFDYTTIKESLQVRLIMNNIKVAGEPSSANLIIVTNNLMYASMSTTNKDDLKEVQAKNDFLQSSSTYRNANNAGNAMNNLSNSMSSTSSAKGAMGAVAGAELMLSFAGPSDTQFRTIVQRIYFTKPSGEIIAEKIYANSKDFDEKMLRAYPIEGPTDKLNGNIADQIFFDLQ